MAIPVPMKANPLQNLIRYLSGVQTAWTHVERADFYALAEAYYHNSVYDELRDGGYRDYVLNEFGADIAQKVEGIYNPIRRAVDLYRYTISGKPAAERFTGAKSKLVPAALDQVYSWSNFPIESRALAVQAANLGTMGIRVVARKSPTYRSYLKFEHPRRIKDIDLNDRGDVKRVLLQYVRMEGRLGEPKEPHVIQEYLSDTVFESYRDGKKFDLINNREGGELWSYPNLLGVCPYVLLRHSYNGDTWGLPAWMGSAGGIDAVNVLASHIDEQIRKHVKVKWFITAAGKPPKMIEMGDTTAAYVQIDPTGVTPPPTINPLVAPLSLADAIAALDQKVKLLRESMPELRALEGEYLSGQSGETIAQLRLPAEELLLEARAAHEDALIRANKIALSWGILLSQYDLGTGMGTAAAAQQAYETGLEDHTFTEREGLPDTLYDKLGLEGRELDNQNKLYTGIETLQRAGAISLEQAVTRANPTWTPAQVAAEVKRIKEATAVPNPDEGEEGSQDPLGDLLKAAAANQGSQEGSDQEEAPEESEEQS